MKVTIPKWVHITGKHCGSTSLRDLSHFYGHPFSEGLCFGLGCGIGVAYLFADFMSPTRIVHLRTMTLEPDFFENLNIPFSWQLESNSEKALETAIESVRQGIPVMLRTDIYHMKYYNSSTHFPGHIVVMWGYDDEKKEVYLSDTHFEGLMALSYGDFMKARKAGPPIPLESDWCPIEFPKNILPLEEAMRRALKKSVKEMLAIQEYPIGKKGVEAIKAVAQELGAWKDVKDAAWCFRFSYQVIEKRGTGGGGFRRLYSEFLKECSEKLPELRGLSAERKMTESADMWTAVAEDMRLISDEQKPEYFANAKEKLMQIYKMEKSFFEELSQVIQPEAMTAKS